MIELNVAPREGAKSKQLRNQGLVPIGIQRGGEPTLEVVAKSSEFRYALKQAHGHKMMVRHGKEKPFEVLVRQVQFDPLKHSLLSATMQKVSETDVLTVDVEVHTTGVPESVDNNIARITFPTTHVQLKGVLKDIPEQIELDVSGLGENDKVLASDLKLPKGIELASSGEAVLATTQTAHMPNLEPETTEEPASVSEAPAESSEE